MAVTYVQARPRVRNVLQDTDGVRWTDVELDQWFDDAVRQIILARPDAYAVTREFGLAAGSSIQRIANLASDDNKPVSQMQSGPAIRLLRVTRNVATGKPIRETSRITLDAEIPDWHKPVPLAQWSGVEHYVFDNISPYTFYVYPCPPAGLATHKIEIIHAAIPASGAGLPDTYINPIVDWVVYRALSKDAEYAGNLGRATQHLNAFAQALQLTGAAEFTAATPGLATPLPASPGSR